MKKSIGFYSGLYILFAVIASLLVVVVINALAVFAPNLMSGGGSGLSAVTIILPPMMVAQTFYKHEQRRMTAREGWGFSVWFTVLAFGVSAAAMWIVLAIQPLTAQDMADFRLVMGEDSSILLTVFGVLAVVLVLTTKLMMWSGIRGAIKQAERLAAKSARHG